MPAQRTSRFRLQFTHVLLTYARSGDLTKEALETHLRTLLPDKTKWVSAAKELHQDGEPHLHAVLSLNARHDLRNARFFDWMGKHPNITKHNGWKKPVEYIRKDGDYCGDHPETADRLGYGDLVSKATGPSDFAALVLQHHPRDAVLFHDRIQAFANAHWTTPSEPYVHPEEFTFRPLPRPLLDWTEQRTVRIA